MNPFEDILLGGGNYNIFVWIIVNLEHLISISNVDIFEFTDQCMISAGYNLHEISKRN